ncbi:pyridoxal-phosphate dependent enzyme family protein [Mycobacterium ulcerans str. Harvey]|uniref:Pyridoxal-phosphate dependent enzyme family protein n=1 Tax=Mycobacterium ulcerans str. Harvey TaxID=1299332 RepID=A0ABN0QZU1_MYCUL|nr:pyridoxal-phosphate dependent enzyme family protein [Mycobacterium ulcerans str. Harvey]
MNAYLHQRFPELRTTLERVTLGDGRTPVRPLSHLISACPSIWIKDDGAYGSGGWGGNKVRKLEWLLPEVRRQRRSTILTFGGLGTNWGLAATLYAAELGIHTALALIDQPVDEHVEAQLDRLRASGADIYLTDAIVDRHRGRVWGTVAGLHLGLTLAGLTDIQVIGVVVNDKLRLDHRSITSLARRAARLLQDRGAKLPSIDLPAERLTLLRDWLGPGYGHPTSQGTLALKLARESEHLDLEPVYTAKAMAALLDLPAHQRAAVARTGVPCCTRCRPHCYAKVGAPYPPSPSRICTW